MNEDLSDIDREIANIHAAVAGLTANWRGEISSRQAIHASLNRLRETIQKALAASAPDPPQSDNDWMEQQEAKACPRCGATGEEPRQWDDQESETGQWSAIIYGCTRCAP